MIDLDIIQPTKTDCSAPVDLVGKKDGISRIFIDLRKLNAIIKKDALSLPMIDQILDCLNGPILQLLGPSGGLLASTTR